MGMIEPTRLRNGSRILIDGDVYIVTDFTHITPGNWRGMVRTRMKSLSSGKVIERTFRTNDMLEEAEVDFAPMQFLYRDDSGFHFLNLNNYEQHTVPEDEVGFAANFLVETAEVTVAIFNNRAIGIELPKKLDFEVVETADAVRGNTATNVTKDAKISTGFIVKVPLFVKRGEKIRVNTETGEYVERA